MARSLRKHKLDGTPYFRRDKVEFEIQALAEISAAELERRADLWQVNDPEFVSPEALLYFVRNAAAGAHRDKLTEKLLLRVASRVPSVADAGGKTVSLTKMNTYAARADVEGYARLVPLEDILQNDCNLNVVRYVEAVEPICQVDLEALRAERAQLRAELEGLESRFASLVQEVSRG